MDRLYADIRAYKRSRAIATAIHLGILSELRKHVDGKAIPEIANALSLSREWLRAILNVLVKEGLVDESKGRYRLTPFGIEADDDAALSSFAGYHLHCFESWVGLPNVLKSGRGGGFHRLRLQDPDFCRTYLMSMERIAQSNLPFLESQCGSILRGSVLDIGAGPATLCRRLARQDKNLRVTALDLHEIVSTARELFESPANFEWVAQDFLEWETSSRVDAVYCGHVIEYCTQRDLSRWLRILRSFLREPGYLVLLSFLRGDDGACAEDLDLFEISTGLNGFQLGYVPKITEITEALTTNGFQNIEIRAVPDGPSYLEYVVIGRLHSNKEPEQT